MMARTYVRTADADPQHSGQFQTKQTYEGNNLMEKTHVAEGVCSLPEIQAELAGKRKRIQHLIEELRLDAILISRHENIAWMSAGIVDVRVGLLKETGVASLLITKDDRAFYLTTNNEAPRLAEEEFSQLDYQPLVQPWYANEVQSSIESVVGNGAVGADVPIAGMRAVSLQYLRFQLTATEVERYRWLGRHIASVATTVLLQLRPGMNEKTIQARLAEHLISLDILPSVFLDAVDKRIGEFRHPVPRSGVLKQFGMIGFCARRWGLSASITRFVHFGRMPKELEDRFAAVADVNARLQAATVEGASADMLFEIARAAYASLGYSGEETMHHQGGATGYLEREWVARPGGSERVTTPQAFAWNANLQGAKVEDTVLVQAGSNRSIELLTSTPDLPTVVTRFDGVNYYSAGVLTG